MLYSQILSHTYLSPWDKKERKENNRLELPPYREALMTSPKITMPQQVFPPWVPNDNSSLLIDLSPELCPTSVLELCCSCSVARSCPTLCNPMDCTMPGFPVLHYLLVFAQTHVHWVSDAIQPSHPLSSPSLPALYLCQHQSLFQWVGSSHQVAKVLALQHQSFQWIFRVDFL